MQLGPKALAIKKGNEKGEDQNLTDLPSSLIYIKQQIDILLRCPIKSCIYLFAVMRED